MDTNEFTGESFDNKYNNTQNTFVHIGNRQSDE